MFSILPIFCFLLLIFVFKKDRNLREAFVYATLAWGTFVAFTTEIFSQLKLIEFWPILISWILLIIGLSHYLIKKRKFSFKEFKKEQKKQIQSSIKEHGALRVATLFVPASLILFLTFLVAFYSPPNNWDSMTYHMSRVVHWMANGHLEAYPTNITRQIILNPWAEIAIMHFQILLNGSDRFANLIQWFSFLGVMITASLIVKELGGNFISQILAVLLVATVPMVILQSTSTQNDLVVAFWITCFAYFVLKIQNIEINKLNQIIFACAVALGIAIYTKGTAYTYGFPFALLASYWIYKRGGIKQFGKSILVVTLIILAFNLRFLKQNYEVFGHPLGSPHRIKYTSNQADSLGLYVSTIAKNIFVHLDFPSSNIDQFVGNAQKKFHDVIGVEIDDYKTTHNKLFYFPPYFFNHEDHAANPYHTLLFLFCLPLLFWRRLDPKVRIYGICSYVGVTFFILLMKWQPWISRLHTGFFILTSIYCSVLLSKSFKLKKSLIGMGILFVFLAKPYLFHNRSRPLIPTSDTINKGIFSVPREVLYFANRPPLYPYYDKAVKELIDMNCDHVGLVTEPDNWEYPLWAYSRNRGKKILFEHIEVNNNTSDFPRSHKINNPMCAIVNINLKPNWTPKAPYTNFKPFSPAQYVTVFRPQMDSRR